MELSVYLRGEVDGHATGISGDQGLQKGKLLPKPKAMMDAYRVSKSVFSFEATSIDAPLRVCQLKEKDLLSLPLSMVQRLKRDSQVLTMVIRVERLW